MPIDFRKPCGKSVSVMSAAATVAAEKATVRPAVAIVVRIAPGVGARPQLLAVARDEEQRVVDRQAEPEPDHEVQREHVQAVDLVDARQHEERPEHGGDADGQRHQRRAAAEEQQREQQQDREGDHLRAPEVGADGLADLQPGDGAGRRR